MSSCSCNDIVGYKFQPTDKELIDHFLWNKALDRDSAVQASGEVTGDFANGNLENYQVSTEFMFFFFRCKIAGHAVHLLYI